MGSRGPVPKRSESRQRRNSPEPTQVPTGVVEVKQPSGSRSWSPSARKIWKSLGDSGQARFFQPSDWAYAQFVMEEITRYQSGDRQNGQVLSGLLSALTSLLMTEGDRRRAGIELTSPQAGKDSGLASVEVMDKWKRKLG